MLTALLWVQASPAACAFEGELFIKALLAPPNNGLCKRCNAANEENFNPTERKADGGFIEYLRVGGRSLAQYMLQILSQKALELVSLHHAACMH